MEVIRYNEGKEYFPPDQPERRARIFKTKQESNSKDLQIGMTFLGPGKKAPLHRHDSVEAMIVIHGEGKWYTDKQEEILKPMDIVFASPGEPHGYENVSTSQTLEFIWIYAPPGAERRILDNWTMV